MKIGLMGSSRSMRKINLVLMSFFTQKNNIFIEDMHGGIYNISVKDSCPKTTFMKLKIRRANYLKEKTILNNLFIKIYFNTVFRNCMDD